MCISIDILARIRLKINAKFTMNKTISKTDLSRCRSYYKSHYFMS